MSRESDPVDSKTIRQTYTGILWAARLPEAEELETACGLLTGHVQLLLPEVMALAARMRGMTRLTAVHCLVRAHQLVVEEADAPAAPEIYVQDLAIISRALHTLYEHPGSLGPPTGAEEIEKAVQRRMCGISMQPIEE